LDSDPVPGKLSEQTDPNCQCHSRPASVDALAASSVANVGADQSPVVVGEPARRRGNIGADVSAKSAPDG